MEIRLCDAAHVPEIADILNDAILHTTAIYDYQPRSLETMRQWFEAKQRANFPVLGCFADQRLLGFGSFGTFRAFPAYKYSVEHSVYVHPEHRGRGVGKQLLQAVISAAQTQNYHVLMGVIDSSNEASIALHEKFGFKLVGRLPEIGFKFNRWLEAVLYQLVLPTPLEPRDDA